eukprot:c18747_g1_i1 orf=1-1206(+)
MAGVDGDGRLARHLDDYIGGMIYAMVGQTGPESQLQYQLELSHNSLRDLHRQLEELQHKCHSLEYKYVKAKEEASLNAVALKRRFGEFEALREKCEQLSRECELYHRDIEVFTEAAEDAEERRAEAERRATEAEKRATEAEKRERAAMLFAEQVMRDSPNKTHHVPSPEKENVTPNRSVTAQNCVSGIKHRSESSVTENRAVVSNGTGLPCQTSPERCTSATVNQGNVNNRGGKQAEERSHTGRKILSHSNHAREDGMPLPRKNLFQNDEDGKEFLPGRKVGDNGKCKVAANLSETIDTEKFRFCETEARSIRQAAQSDINRLSLEISHLIRLIKIGQNNLLKAELEADTIQARNWELQRLLCDIIATFGILPQNCFERQVTLSSQGAQSPSKLPRSSSAV